MTIKKGVSGAFMCFALALMGTQTANAVSLDVDYPNFRVSNMEFEFELDCATCTAGTGLLTVEGTPTSYTEDNTNPAVTNMGVFNGDFQMTVYVNSIGQVVTDSTGGLGTMTLDGIVLDGTNGFDLVPSTHGTVGPFDILYNGYTGDTWDTSLPCDSTSCTPATQNGGSNGHLLNGNFEAGRSIGWDSGPNPGNGSGGVINMRFQNADGLIADGPLYIQGRWPHNSGGMVLQMTALTELDGTPINCDPPADAACAGWDFDTDLWTRNWKGTGFGDVYVPVPPAVWLFGSSLLCLFRLRRSSVSRDKAC